MASGGGGCSASERLPPPFPGMDPESEGAAGGSEPEAGDSDTEGEDIFTGAAAAVSPPPPLEAANRKAPLKREAKLIKGSRALRMVGLVGSPRPVSAVRTPGP